MKKFALIVLLFSCSIISIAQGSREKIDSLLNIVESLDGKSKVDVHIELASKYQYVRNGLDSLKLHTKKALELSEKINYISGLQSSYYYLGKAAFLGREDFALAKQHFLKARTLMLENEDFAKIHEINNAIGTIEIMQGNYKEALLTLQEAYEGATKYEDFESLSMISTNLGLIYNNIKDTLNSIKIHESAIKHLAKTEPPQRDITSVNVYLNLASLYRKSNQMNKMDSVLKNARALVDDLKIFSLEARLSSVEAQVMDAKGEYKRLYEFVNKKLPIFEKTEGFDRGIYTTLLYYKGRGNAEEGNYNDVNRVIKILKEFLGKSNSNHEKNLLHSIYHLSELIGNYKDAYKHLEHYNTLNDSLLSIEQKETVLVLQEKYNSEKKDKEIEKKKVENLKLKKNNSLLLSGVLGLITIALLSYLWYYRRRQKEIDRINQIEQKMLSLQMNPHFIFNAISSIQNYLFDEGDSKKAIHHLSTFANLMRQMLENSRERFIPLEEELEFLKNYLNLQKLRFDEKFNYEIKISDDIDPNTLSIPPLLTQPFIENAIDHGKIYLVENGFLKINIYKESGDLVVQIMDNGVGLGKTDDNNDGNKPLVIKKKSLSIAITNERLQLLSKLMKKKFNLEIKSNESGTGTVVNLNIPSVSLN